jgi:Zn-dependent M28 family amino/carboxypeptidase
LVGYRKKAESSSLTLHGSDGEIAYGENLTYWSTSQKPEIEIAGAPLVFVGYGVEASEVGWDDFKGYDTKGKVLVFLNNDPPVEEDGIALFGGEARTYYGRWTYKFEQAMRHGAVGAIMIHTTPSAGYGWQVIGDSGEHEGFALDLPGSGFQLDFLAWAHEDLAGQLAATVGSNLEQWFADASQRDFQPVELPITLDARMEVEVRKTASQNVVGLLPGSDPERRDEILVFTAHYDHLGKSESGEGDLIFNGAWDNGLGTASILEIARGLVRSEVKPARSIAFVACAAEEKGSLGSRWFVAKPPVERSQLVANINVDMPQIFGLTRDIAAIGRDTNTLGDMLIQVAKDLGVEDGHGGKTPILVTGDPDPNAGKFYRSDQVNFAKAGIPALFINPGSDFVGEIAVDPKEYRDQHYHQASDEINEVWDLAGCARDMELLALTALNVANQDEIPRWKPGNEFEEKWKELHPGM